MGIRSAISDLRQLRDGLDELLADEPVEEERARWKLAQSAHLFSRRTRAVVDDKLSMSATLMRAGEVHEANLLLEEVERDVKTEEAALIEVVNEVKIAGAVRRERMTRMRMARMMAVALLGASVMAFSAIGVSLASMLDDQGRPAAEGFGRGAAARALAERVQERTAAKRARNDLHVRVAGVNLSLSRAELLEYRELTSGTVDRGELQDFLSSLLPVTLAQQVTAALISGVSTEPVHTEDVIQMIEKTKDSADAPQPAEQTPSEPAPDPSSDETDDPAADEPSEDEGDGDGERRRKKGRSGPDDDGSKGAAPLPGPEVLG